MRHTGTALIGLVALACGGGPLQAQSPGTTTGYEIDGLRVVHREVATNEVVSVRLYLQGGSALLGRYPEGIEALLLTTSLGEVESDLEAAGARARSSVGQDWSTTGFVTLEPDLEDAWAAWAPSVVGPELNGGAITRNRSLLLSDARQRFSDADTRVRWLAWQSIFRNHPYRLDPLGTVESIRSINATAVREFWDETFVKSRMLLVVVGDVSQERLSGLVEGSFADRPVGAMTWTQPPDPVRLPNSWRTENRALPTNYIQGFILGPPAFHRDYFAFEVATNLLSGRLNSVLRSEQGLTYNTYASFEPGAIPVATVFASAPDPNEIYRLLIEQLEWVQTLDRVPTWALNRYLDSFNLDQLSQNLTADGQVAALGRAAILFGDYRMADRYLEQIQDVSPRDIRRVAIQYMRELQLAYLGNVGLSGAGTIGGR